MKSVGDGWSRWLMMLKKPKKCLFLWKKLRKNLRRTSGPDRSETAPRADGSDKSAFWATKTGRKKPFANRIRKSVIDSNCCISDFSVVFTSFFYITFFYLLLNFIFLRIFQKFHISSIILKNSIFLRKFDFFHFFISNCKLCHKFQPR